MVMMNIQYNYVINGGFEHRMSPLDRGLSYGDGVFRTLKVLSGSPVDWVMHYQKLLSDCSAIGIVCPSPELILNDIDLLFKSEETGVVKIIITRGEGERGYAPPAVTSPTRIVLRSELPQYPSEYFNHGVKLFSCNTILSSQPKLAGVKHLNRLENVLARSEWQGPEYVDGVMLDAQGNVIECTSANIFIRIDKTLMTPDLSNSGVAGVTRQRILDIAESLLLTPVIKTLKLTDVLYSDEMVICNSLYGAWQVRDFQTKHWQVGDLARNLRRLLNE
jgi:4-amino-4-deoxychorismate lyase